MQVWEANIDTKTQTMEGKTKTRDKVKKGKEKREERDVCQQSSATTYKGALGLCIKKNSRS